MAHNTRITRGDGDQDEEKPSPTIVPKMFKFHPSAATFPNVICASRPARPKVPTLHRERIECETMFTKSSLASRFLFDNITPASFNSNQYLALYSPSPYLLHIAKHWLNLYPRCHPGLLHAISHTLALPQFEKHRLSTPHISYIPNPSSEKPIPLHVSTEPNPSISLKSKLVRSHDTPPPKRQPPCAHLPPHPTGANKTAIFHIAMAEVFRRNVSRPISILPILWPKSRPPSSTPTTRSGSPKTNKTFPNCSEYILPIISR